MRSAVAEERVVWTSVFADGPDGGNPCPVVFGASDWTTERMRARAEAFGVETVFVLPPQLDGDVRLRYFVPRHEMEMCVHATVAAAIVLARAGELANNPARVETALGTLDVRSDLATASAVVHQFAPTFGPAVTPPVQTRVLAALNLPADAIATGVGPVCSVSTARAKLMIPLRDEVVLDGIVPDPELLWTVCDELEVTGCYPFTLVTTGADAAARQFPNRSGYLEDPATGVAACGLGAYLTGRDGTAVGWRTWRIAQGRALGRPSLITAEAHRSGAGTVTATRVGGAMTLIDPLVPITDVVH